MKKITIIQLLACLLLATPIFAQVQPAKLKTPSQTTSSTQVKPAEQKANDLKLPDSVNRFTPDGLKTGYWIEKQADLTSKGEYLAGKKTGSWITYYPNQFVHKLEIFQDGNKEGISLQFDRHGKLTLLENYSKGVLHGQVLYYGQYAQTPMSETNFSNGKKSGLFRQYYDNAKIQEDTYYQNDLKNGSSRWYNKTGRMIAEYNYLNGNFEGEQKTFYDNDTLQNLSTYKNNQLFGDYKEYYRNGNLKISGKYVDGLKEGAWIEYDELGKPSKTVKYKADIAK